MKPDLARIRESKQAFRRELAERPIAEKLRMLDVLRERALAIRGSQSGTAREAVVQEAPPPSHNH